MPYAIGSKQPSAFSLIQFYNLVHLTIFLILFGLFFILVFAFFALKKIKRKERKGKI